MIIPTRRYDTLYQKGFTAASLRYLTHRNIVTEYHDHDYYEFFLALEGSITHIINDTPRVIEAGRLYLIRPHDRHAFIRSADTPFKSVNIAFPPSIYRQITDSCAAGALRDRLMSRPDEVSIHVGDDGLARLGARIDAIRAVVALDPMVEHSLYRLLLMDMLYYFIREGIPSGSTPSHWVETLHSRMTRKEYFTRGTACVEELCGKSYEHAARVFRQRYHMTLSRYVGDLRIAYAAGMLLSTDEDVCTIALDAGYDSLSHFYAQFKNRRRLSPTEYRKRFMVRA